MDFSKLDQYLEEMPQRGIPACELAVTRDGEQIYRKSVGFSDFEGKRPTSEKDLYWIFSASKVITCTAAMRLVEEGKLSLADPVSKFVPEFAQIKVRRADGSVTPAENIITVEHLFTMSGGMTYELDHKAIAAEPDISAEGFARFMASTPLVFEPGTHYKYSLCHDVLAVLVELVSGMRFSEYLKKYIFEPLGVKDMGFFPNEEQRERLSANYRYKNGTASVEPHEIKDCPFAFSGAFESGGAGLFASVDDYMKIITAIACGGTAKNGYRLLKPETIKMMQKNLLCDDALNDFVKTRLYGYGWGLCGRVHMNPVMSGSKTPVGEFGWDGAAGAFVLIDPENRIAIYYAQQVERCDYIYHIGHHRIKDLVYEELLK